LSCGKRRKTWCGIVTRADQDETGAVVLLSGGLDSTVSLALSFQACKPRLALLFDYNQRALSMEMAAAGSIANHYGLVFRVIDISWLGGISRSALVKGGGQPPDVSPEELDRGGGGFSREVWVENRNGIFINIAAAVAAAIGCSIVITGFNSEEAEEFPDNSAEYLERMNALLELGAGASVRAYSPTLGMRKREIVDAGLRLGIPWSSLWSCYRDGPVMCGRCESCRRLARAVSGTSAESEIRFMNEEG
jgi:7-cyano-7-deazaguanine synthase